VVRFGCTTKFHEYIYGKNLKIETDHKLLVYIFAKHLQDAPARLRRFRLDVMVCKPQIDTLSRDCDVNAEVNETDDLEVLVVLDLIDRIHEELSSLIQHGWPDEIDQVSKKIKKFWNFREELTVYENLLFKGDRLLF
jgi:hypothetical protein